MYRELFYLTLAGLVLVGAGGAGAQTVGQVKPIYPEPGALYVSQRVMLEWRPGARASQYDVYFGKNEAAVASADRSAYRGRQEPTTCPLGPLEWGQTYFWRVDAINEREPNNPRKGVTWSFTTANFLLVDDFESYTGDQDEGKAISESWTVVDPENNGGEVPYVEQRIVFAGKRSMRFRYDNTGGVKVSVVERTFLDRPLNLSVREVDSLVLFVRGRRKNAADRLYISLDDGTGPPAVSVHSDPDILLRPRWTAWSIPLREFAPREILRAVKRMRIGVGDPTSTRVAHGGAIRRRPMPAPGSSGEVYIDQIIAAGPSFGVLMGTVKRTDNTPISGATVTVSPPGFQNSPSTPSDGFYAVLLIRGLSYEVNVRAPQFQSTAPLQNWIPTKTVTEQSFVLSP